MFCKSYSIFLRNYFIVLFSYSIRKEPPSWPSTLCTTSHCMHTTIAWRLRLALYSYFTLLPLLPLLPLLLLLLLLQDFTQLQLPLLIWPCWSYIAWLHASPWVADGHAHFHLHIYIPTARLLYSPFLCTTIYQYICIQLDKLSLSLSLSLSLYLSIYLSLSWIYG